MTREDEPTRADDLTKDSTADEKDSRPAGVAVSADGAETPGVEATSWQRTEQPLCAQAVAATPGSVRNPLQVAVVGSGPSAFYTAEMLLRSGFAVAVDLYERLPTPFGLVRYGVAPDHAKLKNGVIRAFVKIAARPGLRFFGNVAIGVDLDVTELREAYHAVVFACGAGQHRQLGIPGEDLSGCHDATEFVGWYNGHPDFCDREFDLSEEVAVVIGQGNVALDVARILVKRADELALTDMTDYALGTLAASRVREVHIVGRRGPVQAKFGPAELGEMGRLAGCAPVVDAADLALDPISERELRNDRRAAKNLKLFDAFAGRRAAPGERICRFRFLETPLAIYGTNRLSGVTLAKNRLSGEPGRQRPVATGAVARLDAGLLIRSIGYRSEPIGGLPFDRRQGNFPHRNGRLLDDQGRILPGLYAVGWVKRGPTGVIGTNKVDSSATVETLLTDLPSLTTGVKPGGDGIAELLRKRGVRWISFADWQRIDAAEMERGRRRGKPREKFCRISEMLAVLD